MFPEGQKAVRKRQPKECWVRDTKHSQEAEKCVASEYMLYHLFPGKGQSSNSMLLTDFHSPSFLNIELWKAGLRAIREEGHEVI